MPKGSPELVSARREEIINACAQLYKTMSFKDITIKEIGRMTSFTRTSIYNYFETREEIFLALLEREYWMWHEQMSKIKTLDREELAQKIASSVAERQMMLKLLSMNLFEIEEHVRLENLIEFKKAYGATLEIIQDLVGRCYPQKSEAEISCFIYAFFPFIFGIYPYTVISERKKEAMLQAGIEVKELSIYEITYMNIKQLLGN